MNKVGGFTLLELLVVIVLASAVVATVAVQLAPVYQRAQLEMAVERLTFFESQTRMSNWRTHQPAWVVYDLQKQAIFARAEDREGAPLLRKMRLPAGIHLREVQMAGKRAINRGKTTLAVSPRGATASYVVSLASDQQETWILFAGHSGAVQVLESKTDAKRLLQAIAKMRPNAD